MVAKLVRITSASSTVRYFEKDSGIAPGGPEQYYAGRDFEHKAASSWVGDGARMLKLRGPVDVDDFKAVLGGRVPGTDIQLGRRVVDKETGKVSIQHNPGDDLTFSAPKSVSLAALMFQEKEALDAHENAVTATLQYIQAHHIETRRNQTREPTGKMVAATFRHDTSRNHDPQLHTHSIIANMTRREDGKWMSIDRGSVSLNIRLIEAYYHNELAKNLRESGYRLKPVQHGGKRIFEIDGYDIDVLEEFSSRRRDILKDINDRGIAYSHVAAQRAALRTRRKKEEISREVLHERWGKQVNEMGFDNPSSKKERRKVRKEMRKLRDRGNNDALGRDIEADLHAAIRTSLEHLGYHTPVISDTVLKADVMGHLAGRVTLKQIEGRLSQMEKDRHLFRSKKPGSRSAWVTREALAAERGVVKYMRAGRGQADAIRPDFDKATGRLTSRGLTFGQVDSIYSILTTQDKVSGVQGYAGTGKTTMLKTLIEMAPKHCKFIGLAPTVGASVLLGAEAGLPSNTLQSFLKKHSEIATLNEEKLDAARNEHKDTVVVVDEASMIGTRQMESLFEITDKLGIERLVLVGDKKQLRSIEAGQSFMQLQQYGMETAVMEDIVRQKHDGLKVPVEMMLAGNVSCALERLGDKDNEQGRLVEVEREELHRSAADIYLNLNDRDRQETIVMAQTNHDRQAINEEIRNGLYESGRLEGVEYEGERLVHRHMTPIEKADPLNYEPGDVLVYHSKYRSDTGEDHYTVTDVGRDGRLHIESASGHKRDFHPARGKAGFRYEVFEAEDISLLENDLIRITRNDPDLRKKGIVNGAGASVEKISRKTITLRLVDDDQGGRGQQIKLGRDHNALKHIDHGYCRTTYTAQGQTAERVIAVADSALGHLADQQNFYVQISRASDEAVVLTDDILHLTENLEKHTGERLTAMEAVGDSSLEDEREQVIELSEQHVRDDEQQRALEGEIRIPEFSLPGHFPPHLAAMLNRTQEETNARPERQPEDAQQQPPPRPAPDMAVDRSPPVIEQEEMEREEVPQVADASPEKEPTIDPPIPPAIEEERRLAANLLKKRPDAEVNQPEQAINPMTETGAETGTETPAKPDTTPSPDTVAGPAPYMGKIGNGVIEVTSEKLIEQAAMSWLELPKNVRDRTGILANPEHQSRIAEIIRSALKEKGQISGPSIEVTRRALVPLGESDKLNPKSFHTADMLRFNRDIPETEIKANTWVSVLGHSEDGGSIRVRSRKLTDNNLLLGEKTDSVLTMGEMVDCQVFRDMPLELKAGDRIRWRRDSEEHGIAKTSKSVVAKVEGPEVHLRTQQGRETVLHRYSPLFIACDYAFNLSAWEYGNGAVENVIAVTDTNKPAFGILEIVGNEIERKTSNAVLLTNNIKSMNEQLKRIGKQPIDVGQSIKGQLVGKGKIGDRSKSRERDRGMGMGM